ncbi:MAG: methylmalonyl Co-A mutase-associated GTPase MeaB, partial [Natronococcus sp.]
GKDKIVIETVGAGQNEIDIVRTADTVAVLVPPGSGDEIQTLKAGILEIADVFVVNKADRDGTDRTVQELRDMIQLDSGDGYGSDGGTHHSQEVIDAHDDWDPGDNEDKATGWTTPIVETVATRGEGVEELLDEFEAHREYLVDSDERAAQVRQRYTEEIRTLLREDVHAMLEEELEAAGGIDDLAESVRRGETDPYSIAGDLLEPVENCVGELRVDEG